jgi:hypothetical protein
MREIVLTQGKVTLVDDVDYEILCRASWYALKSRRTFYAVHGAWIDGTVKQVPMHRLVLSWKLGRDVAQGLFTDHEDGNGLNNQRYNLREATHAQNMRNCRRRRVKTVSQYLGVTFLKARGTWRTFIHAFGKHVYLGDYATEIEAALAREAYIAEHPELNARSNFTKGIL